MDAYNQARTQEERVKRWADVQQAVYDEIPFIKVGDFNAQGARSPSLQGTAGAVAVLLECLEERCKQRAGRRADRAAAPPLAGMPRVFALI